MNLLPANRKVLIIIIILLFLIFVLFAITLFSSRTTNQPSPVPSETPVGSDNPDVSPTSAPQVYDAGELRQDFQRIANKQPLVNNDAEIRASLIASLGGNSGILDETAEYKIEYVKAPDQFMVEIKANQADQAKAKALDWFKQQELSDKGVCDLPVVIYLSFDVKNYYQQNRLPAFNPIPEGC